MKEGKFFLISFYAQKLTAPGRSNLNLSFSGTQQNVLC